VPKVSKRIYKVRSKNGKKTVFIAARSKGQAERYVMATYFDTTVATHEELLVHWDSENPEVVDVSDPEQTDLTDPPEPPADDQQQFGSPGESHD
jgi:hypothetical protein